MPVGEKGGGPSLWLGIGIINRSVCNLRMVGGGFNPYGLVAISTPASPRTLYGFLGFHTGYDDLL